MEPAGEMWSVVTLSPSIASTRGAVDLLDRLGVGSHRVEVRRSEHVGRIGVPLEGLARRRLDRGPALVAVENRCVALPVNISDVTNARTVSITSASLGHRSASVTALAVGGLCDRVVVRVEVHGPGKRVSDDERRRGEVVEAHLVVDAALEVAVAREHGRRPTGYPL